MTIPSKNSKQLSNLNAMENNRDSCFAMPKQLISTTDKDSGLFIIAKSRNDSSVRFYGLCEESCTRKYLPKYHLNTIGINTFTMKIFSHQNQIYVCYSTKNQQLQIKSWCFKTQSMTDLLTPITVQHLRPRLVNAIGGEILVSEEKYAKWPYEGFKITACKFGIGTKSYKSIEFTYDSLKEIIYFENEIFAFSNQKPEVVSFDINTMKRTPRGSLNKHGIVRAVVFHANLYVGCYIRLKSHLYIERYDKKNSHWNTVRELINTLKTQIYQFCFFLYFI